VIADPKMRMRMSSSLHAQFPQSIVTQLLCLLLSTIWFGALCYPAGPVAAQRREMRLSLREATAFALEGNLDIQIAGLEPRIREAQITEEKGIFDVEARASLLASDARLLDTSTIFLDKIIPNGLAGQDDSQQQELTVGVAQLTPYGGAYEARVSETHLETSRRVVGNVLRLGERVETYTGAVELRATQPLLRNFGSTVTQNRILIAQNNLTISQEDFRQQIIVVTSGVQQIYWDLVFRRQDLEVRLQQLALAERLLDQIRRQVAVGTLAPIEVLQAETNIARIKERIIVGQNTVRSAEDRLKRVMNFGLTSELADVELLPIDIPAYTAPALEQDVQIQQALEHRPALIQAKIALENQNISLVFDKNQTLPTLDLTASLRFNGLHDSFGGSFEEFELDKRYRWDVGVVFRYPLANRRAKGRLEQSRLAIRRQLLRIKNLEETTIAEVRAAVRDALTNAQRVQATRAASRLAEKQLEAEEKKLQVGLATVFTVLQFQEDLAIERSNEINALTEYLKAIVRLEEVKGTLLQTYDIILQADGPRLQ
jgi:outer membrane protein